MRPKRVWFFAVLACVLALRSGVALAEKTVLQIGVAESMPFYDAELMGDWKRYLSGRVKRPVEFLHRPSHSDILNLLVQGRLEFAWICPAHFQRHQNKTILVATPVFQGNPRFQALLLAPAGTAAEMDAIEDLRDKVIAFAEPDSNLGSALIKRELRARGEDPHSFFRRVFYTGDHSKVVYAVAEGLAHGGVVMDRTWEVLKEREPEVAARIRVIWRSGWRPMPPIVSGNHADPGARQALREAFVDMAHDPEGQRILGRLHFDRFADGLSQIYEPITMVADAMEDATLPTCGE